MKKRCFVCGQESAASFNTCSACLTPFIDTSLSQVRTLRDKQDFLKSNSRAIELEAALKDLTLLSVISQKEKSIVYLAQHLSSKTKFAVRVSSYTTEEQRQRSLNNTIILEKLQHSAAPRIYQHGVLSLGRVFVVSEYITGQSLRAYIKQRRQLSPTKATAIGGQILLALDVVHKVGILHQNLRPENIYLREFEGRKVVTLLGFGVSQDIDLKSPGYLSPEQVMGEGLDVRSDLYSLGVVLFEMITGRLPFLAKSVAELLSMQREEQPPLPSTLVRDLPRRLDEVLSRCLEKHRDDRPVNAITLKEQLLNALHSSPMVYRSPQSKQIKKIETARPWLLVVLVFGILAFGFLLGVIIDSK
jgi:serine/threonine protein kinase